MSKRLINTEWQVQKWPCFTDQIYPCNGKYIQEAAREAWTQEDQGKYFSHLTTTFNNYGWTCFVSMFILTHFSLMHGRFSTARMLKCLLRKYRSTLPVIICKCNGINRTDSYRLQTDGGWESGGFRKTERGKSEANKWSLSTQFWFINLSLLLMWCLIHLVAWPSAASATSTKSYHLLENENSMSPDTKR